MKGNRGALRAAFANNQTEFTMALATVLMFAALSVIAPMFATARNMTNILSQVSYIAILSIGQSFVMLTGGIDLSVGSIVGVSSILLATVLKSSPDVTTGIVLGISVCLFTGIAVGFLNGVLVSIFDIPPFVVTLGMMQICRSADYLICDGRSITKLGDAFKTLSGLELFTGFRGYYLLTILLFILAGLTLSKTKIGRNLYAIGNNVVATRLAGVNVTFYRAVPYVISGFLCGLCGAIMSSRFGAVDPNYGSGYEMSTLAAAVIGGISMAGGKGTIVVTAIGVIFMGILQNGLDVVGISPYWQNAAVGSVIIVVLLFERLSHRGKGKAN